MYDYTGGNFADRGAEIEDSMKTMKEIWESIPPEARNDAVGHSGAMEFFMKHQLGPVRELVMAAFLAGFALQNEARLEALAELAKIKYGIKS